MTPGLIDCHTHLVHAGNRAAEFEMRLAGATYEEIARAGGGIVSSVKATRAASEDELVAQSLPRLDALLAEGVTTVEIKSGYGLDIGTELKMLRVARGRRPSQRLHLHDLARRPCDPARVQGPQWRLHRGCGAARDGSGQARGPCRCGRRVLRRHRFFSGRNPHRVREGPRPRPAGEAACRPAVGPGRRGDGGAVRRALGGPPGIHRRNRRRRHGRCWNRRGPAARRVLFSQRNAQAAGRAFPRTSRADGGGDGLQSGLLAIDLAAAHHEHGLDTFRHERRGVPGRRDAQRRTALGLEAQTGSLDAGKRADLAIWDAGRPAELVYRIGFNPLHRRISGGAMDEPRRSNR